MHRQAQIDHVSGVIAHYQAQLERNEEMLRYAESHSGPLILQHAANGDYIDATEAHKDGLRRAISEYREIIADWSAKN
jgi:hypothetical protein